MQVLKRRKARANLRDGQKTFYGALAANQFAESAGGYDRRRAVNT